MERMALGVQQMSSEKKFASPPFHAVMFVCLGNICRSPTAEAVLRRKADEHGVLSHLHIESSGLGRWHLGQLPDKRSRLAAEKRGYLLQSRAKAFEPVDFDRFTYILAADDSVVDALVAMARTEDDKKKIYLMTHFSRQHQGSSVPDPYHGGESGFEHVLDMIEESCLGLLNQLYKKG